MPVSPDLDVSRAAIENLVGQSVDDLSLYQRALTHRSLLRRYPNRDLQSNERLEFLGDALLDLVVGEVLYNRYPERDEGDLSRLRARLVSEAPLARYARHMDLGASLLYNRYPERDEGDLSRLRARLVSEAPLARYARHMDLGASLLMTDNTAADGGRTNPTILADAFEALAGAVYLDRGHTAARQFVHDHILAPFDLEEMLAHDTNYKSQLLEHMQANGRPQPTYRVVNEVGPSHDKTFTVEAVVDDAALGQGTGSNKQQAEQRAAREALARLPTDSTAS